VKAVIITQYGGPEVLQVDECPNPTLGPGRLRIQVHAAAVNPADTGSGRRQPMRLKNADVRGHSAREWNLAGMSLRSGARRDRLSLGEARDGRRVIPNRYHRRR